VLTGAPSRESCANPVSALAQFAEHAGEPVYENTHLLAKEAVAGILDVIGIRRQF
jgi:hypothetical protein